MWLDVTMLGSGIAGLVALFTFKTLEQKGVTKRSLESLRQSCDTLVEKGWTMYREDIRERGKQLIQSGYRHTLQGLHEFYVRTLAMFHFAVMRLHVHLSRRRALVTKSRERVSAHLKDMLESKERAKEERKEV